MADGFERGGMAINMMKHSARTVKGEIERRRCGVGVDKPMILCCPDWPDLGQVPDQFPLLPVLRLDVCAILWSAGLALIRGSGEPLHLLLSLYRAKPLCHPTNILSCSKSQSSNHHSAKQVRRSAHAPYDATLHQPRQSPQSWVQK
jgi:hypothetical protein